MENKNDDLSSKEWTAILRIAMGCTRLTDAVAHDIAATFDEGTPYDIKGHVTKKALTYSTALYHFAFSVDHASHEVFRPADIRAKLPDTVKTVQAADLTRELKSLNAIGVSRHVPAVKSRGRRLTERTASADDSLPGRKSRYVQTGRESLLNQFVSQEEIAGVLVTNLIDSRVMRRYFTAGKMLEYKLLRLGKVEDALAIAKSCAGIELQEADVDRLRAQAEGDIRSCIHMSTTWADDLIAKHGQDYTYRPFIIFLVKGGLYYHASANLKEEF